jgi:hypothetical protein
MEECCENMKHLLSVSTVKQILLEHFWTFECHSFLLSMQLNHTKFFSYFCEWCIAQEVVTLRVRKELKHLQYVPEE